MHRRRLDEGGSVGFAVEFAQDETFPQRPRADFHRFYRQCSHARLCHQGAGHNLRRSVGAYPFQFCTVNRRHPRDKRDELPQTICR
ncbi:Uncharacterised protein [Mycobacterium tuberculosis]|nr:Uncharacterised protein [Mycobacterium tuberculosis]